MSITTTERTNIEKLLVLMFNAAPGSTYLAQVVSLYESLGHDMAALANTLDDITAYTALNPNFQTAEEFAAEFLTPLGLEADAFALNFVVSKFNANVPKGQIAYEALVALNGVDSSMPAQYVNAKAILDNKAAVSEYYSVTVGVAQLDIAVLQSVLDGITADTATVTTAEAEIDAGTRGSAGVELTLTPSQDSVVGSAAADVINGLFGDATASNNTFTAGDSIDGGAGTDNLNLVALGTTASSAIIVKNVEAINIQDTVGATFNALLVESNPGINFTNTLTGVTSTVTKASTGSVYGIAGNGNLTVDFNSTSGTSDTAMVSLAGVGTSTAPSAVNVSDGNTVEKVSIATAGTNFVALTGGTGAASLTVTGSGVNTFTLSAVDSLAAVATIDASASTGTNSFALGSNFNTATVVKGGTGADTVSATLASATLSAPTFTGVETFSTTWTAYGVLDLGSATGLTALSVNDKGTGGLVLVQNAQASLATVTVSNVTTADDDFSFGYGSATKGALTLKIGSAAATATAVNFDDVTISNSTALQVTTVGALAHDIDGLTVKGNQTALGFTLAAGSDLTLGGVTATGNLGALDVHLLSNSYFSAGEIALAAGKTIGDVTVDITGSQSEVALNISGGTDAVGNIAFNITGNDNSGYLNGAMSGGGIGNVTVAITGDDNDVMWSMSAGYVSGTVGVGREQGNIGDIAIAVDGDDNIYSGGVNTRDGDIGNITITATGDGNDVNFSGHAEHAYIYQDAATSSLYSHSGYYHDGAGDIGNFSMTVDGDSSGDFGLTSSGGNIGDITVVADNDADIDFFVGSEGSEGWYWDAVAGGLVGNIGNVSVTVGDDSTVSGGVYTSGGDVGTVTVNVAGDNASGHLNVYSRADSGGYSLGADSDDYLGGGNIGDVSISIDGDSSYFDVNLDASGGSIGNVAVSLTGNGASGNLLLNSHPIGSGSTGGDIGTVSVTMDDGTTYYVSGNFDDDMGAFTLVAADSVVFDFEFGGGETPIVGYDDTASIASMSLTVGNGAAVSGHIDHFSGSVGATTVTAGDNADIHLEYSYVKSSVGAMTFSLGTGSDTDLQFGNTGSVGSVGAINYTAGNGAALMIESDGTIASMGAITLTGGDSASTAVLNLDNTGYNIATFGGVNASAWAGSLDADLSQVGAATPATAVGTTIRAGTGGSLILGTEGSDNIFLGAGVDQVTFDATFDANTKTDVIFNFTAGSTQDVLNVYSTVTTLLAVNSTNAATTLVSGDIARLVDIAAGQDITTTSGLLTALQTGEFAAVDITASNTVTIVTAASSSATTFYVFHVTDADAGGDFDAGEITLVGQVNANAGSTIGALVLTNFV